MSVTAGVESGVTVAAGVSVAVFVGDADTGDAVAVIVCDADTGVSVAVAVMADGEHEGDNDGVTAADGDTDGAGVGAGVCDGDADGDAATDADTDGDAANDADLDGDAATDGDIDGDAATDGDGVELAPKLIDFVGDARTDGDTDGEAVRDADGDTDGDNDGEAPGTTTGTGGSATPRKAVLAAAVAMMRGVVCEAFRQSQRHSVPSRGEPPADVAYKMLRPDSTRSTMPRQGAFIMDRLTDQFVPSLCKTSTPVPAAS